MDFFRMDSLTDQFKTVLIESPAVETETARRARALFPKERVRIAESFPVEKGRLSPEQIRRGKKTLLLKNFKGAFFKRCPGARPRLLCCNYHVLNLGQNCEMDCSYCYLQTFINLPAVVVYTNIEDALSELKQIKKSFGGGLLRVGTGEQTDSLSLDDLSLYSRKLTAFFRSCPGWELEFKTKSDNTKNFEDGDHAGNVIVSWSVNPPEICAREERGTSPLTARLSAAERVSKKGFPVSFHIDPMIYHPEWKSGYGGLVREITRRFSPEKVRRISIGALRFPPSQKALMRKRFSMESLVCRGEFFRSGDGKLRYDAGLRREMFRFVYRSFKSQSDKWNVFLCMEAAESWLKVAGRAPMKIPELKKDFDLTALPKKQNLSPCAASGLFRSD